MNSKGITVHMVVKNEDRFIWYAINSILPYADRVFICDTGSSDATVGIIRSVKSPKIEFSQKKIFRPGDITDIRQEQIRNSDTDWLWIVDGDEVYTGNLGKEIKDIIHTTDDKQEGIVVGRYDLMGDIYHYQTENVGTYELFGRRGHFALRLINKRNIPGLHMEGIYPYEGYYDSEGKELISHEGKKYAFTKNKLWHAMYLKRSSSGRNLVDTFHRTKFKIESGMNFPPGTIFPEVFDGTKPDIVPVVTEKRGRGYEIAANIITPVKKIKRKILPK